MAAPPPSLIATSAAAGAQPPIAATPNPLSLRVSVLRKPELYSSVRVDPLLSEEGDILHDVLVEKSRHYDGCIASSVNPILTFSSNRGVHLVGESFKALLSFRNQSGGPLTRLFFRIELVSPQNQRFVLWDKEVARMEPKQNRELRVDHRFVEAGKYSLSVSVAFCDAANEARRFNWSSGVDVARGIVDIARKVTMLPQPHRAQLSELLESASSAHAATAVLQSSNGHRLVIAVTLQNTLPDLALMITNVRLVLRDASQYQVSAAPAYRGAAVQPTLFAHQYSGGGRDALEDGHLMPGDTRQFLFEVVPTPQRAASQSPASSNPAAPVSFFSSGSGAVQKTVELGHVEWEWRRSNGDGGADMSQIIRLNRSTAGKLADVELVCIGAAAAPSAEHPCDPESSLAVSSGGALTPSTATVRVGSVCHLHLIAVNRTNTRKDVCLAVHAQRLLPNVAYSGSTMKPLGFIEANSEIHFTVPVVPLCSGMVPVSGFLELRDARSTATTLWPVKPPQAAAPPPLMQSAAGTGSFTPTVQSTVTLAAEPWPPKLCDLFAL